MDIIEIICNISINYQHMMTLVIIILPPNQGLGGTRYATWEGHMRHREKLGSGAHAANDGQSPQM